MQAGLAEGQKKCQEGLEKCLKNDTLRLAFLLQKDLEIFRVVSKNPGGGNPKKIYTPGLEVQPATLKRRGETVSKTKRNDILKRNDTSLILLNPQIVHPPK